MKPARLRPSAHDDLRRQIHHYAQAGGPALAERVFDRAIGALRAAERDPERGSSLLGDRCDLPGVQAWPVDPFSEHWYYVERADHLDVVRLLGRSPDLDAVLGA